METKKVWGTMQAVGWGTVLVGWLLVLQGQNQGLAVVIGGLLLVFASIIVRLRNRR